MKKQKQHWSKSSSGTEQRGHYYSRNSHKPCRAVRDFLAAMAAQAQPVPGCEPKAKKP